MIYNKKITHSKIKLLKKGKEKIYFSNKIYYEPLESYVRSDDAIKNLVGWRNKNRRFFKDTSTTNIKRTKKWITSVLEDDLKIIFILKSQKYSKEAFGMFGISHFCSKSASCYLENVNKFNKNDYSNFMYLSIKNICCWLSENIQIEKIKINCFSDEFKALTLYNRLGFEPKELIPLKKKKKNSFTCWEETKIDKNVERYFLKMEKKNV